MLLTYEDQTVDFDIDYIKSFKKIGMSLSGGTDSALLFYLLLKFVDDIEIFPWCGIDVHRPAHIWHAREIYETYMEMFPNATNVLPLYEFKVDTRDEWWIKYSLVQHEKDVNNIMGPVSGGLVKQVIIGHHAKQMMYRGKAAMHINALTANPPKEVAESLGFLDKCEERRFSSDSETKLNSFYKPFRNVDKKWVFGMYEKFGLLDTIYPITQSCIGHAKETQYFTVPCKQCYWCHEKLWSFGSYDGGVL